MKVLQIVLLLFAHSKCSEPDDQESLITLSRAFDNITKQLQQVDCMKLSVINYQMDFSKVDAIVLKNLRKSVKSEKIPLVIMNVKPEQLKFNLTRPQMKDNYQINDSAIITAGSVNALRHFFSHSRAGNEFPKSQQLFVLCFGMKSEDILSVITSSPSFLSQIISSLYFIVDEKHFIKLLTFI